MYIFISKTFVNELKTNTPQIKNDLLPSEWQWVKRTFPHYDYDIEAYPKAVVKFNELKRNRKNISLQKLSLNEAWEFVGPTNIGGRIVDIEFNPKEPNIVYAASATGGVFKSIDTGVNWFPIFDDQTNLTIGDIGIDPTNPSIIYVGTGEANGGHNNFPGSGIYKSTDAGSNWEFIGLDSTVSIGRIIVDPNNSNRVFVAAVGSYFKTNPERGIYFSPDGGNNWSKSLFLSDSTGAIDLVMDPTNPNILFAAMWERVRRPVLRDGTHLHGPSGGIFKSIDGGISWNKLDATNGLPNPQTELIGRIGLTISNSDPNTLYATYNDGSQLYGMYKTTDQGNSWTEITNEFPGASSFSWFFGQVRVHPTNPETVFVLDVALMKSTTSGSSWNFTYGYSGPSALHVDHHALAFHPNNLNYIISGNDGGINISIDGGVSWSAPAQLPITQFYEIGLDKTNPNRLYGGTQDNNTIRTLSGQQNDWESIWGGDGFYVIVDPNNPSIIYAESQFGNLAKSTNGGSNFIGALNGIDSNEPTNWSTPVVLDPNNSQVLYYGTNKLYRTENGTTNWNAISNQLTDYSLDRRLGTLTTIAVAPTNSNVIYVGTDDGYVWVTEDYGVTWKDISASLPLRWVTRVVVDPKNENIIYATFSGLRWAEDEAHVFRSINKGVTWQNISNGLPEAPVNAFSVDNRNSDILFLGNDIGAFVSLDAGTSWDILGSGLPIVVVNDMKIHSTENYLAIGTHGRGMYKINLDGITNIKSNPIPKDFSLSQNYPNPFNPTTTIEYTILFVETLHATSLQQQFVELKIYDALGKEVATLVNKEQSVGNHQTLFDASELTSGVYYYSLQINNKNLTKKMIVLK
ncbi:MAG: T9SS type A sorting domain-containing protein [Ignavibacteriae bacterium]|nr:T9SS type A sorting domain-containing protein [Ignavibacteriota bacterium]